MKPYKCYNVFFCDPGCASVSGLVSCAVEIVIMHICIMTISTVFAFLFMSLRAVSLRISNLLYKINTGL
jgi:hypothetical protein